MWWLVHTLGRLVSLVAFLTAALRVLSRLGGGAMELRVSVRSLVHQLVHEQAKASVNLEGLQRDVSTLLDFRDSLMSRSLGPSSSPRPTVPVPSCLPVGSQTAAPAPSTPTELASAATSSGLGTSTSTTGTSTASTSGSGVTTSASGAGGAGCGPESGASGSTFRPAAEDGDELMSLLEAIEAQGRQLVRQTRRSGTESASEPPPDVGVTEGVVRSEPAAAGGARPRCVNCDRTETHGRGAGSSPGVGRDFGARRRLAEQRRPSDVRLLEGAAADLPDWGPGWDRSPLFGDPPPLSLPDLRPGQERLTALTLSERLLQERDALLSQLTGLEQVAVRSQLHAATLQSRLHRVLAVNDALDRELRLAGGQRLLPGPPASPAAPTEDRMARSTPDLRPPSRIPQPVSLRRQTAGRGRSPQPAGQDRSLHRPAGQDRSPHRPAGQDRSPHRPAGQDRSPHRPAGQDRSLHRPVGQDRSLHRPAGQDRSLQSAGRPRSRSRETQTCVGEVQENPLRVVDRSVSAVESTTPVVDSGTSIGICTASVGTCTSLLPQAVVESPSDRQRSGLPQSCSGGSRGIRPPNRTRVSAILSETSPLKLQKELLTLLVEAEALRAQVDSLGRRWVGRRSSDAGESEHQPQSAQADSDDIRLQLEMRNIELEGTRARLRQLEAAWATRPALDRAGRADPGSDGSRRSLSPRPATGRRRPAAGRLDAVAESGRPGSQSDSSSLRPDRLPVPSAGDRLPVSAVRPEPQRPSGAGASPTPPRGERRPATPTRPSGRPGGGPSRPSSRGDGTSSGRQQGRSKTPTRPTSRSGLSTTPSGSLRGGSGPTGTAKPAGTAGNKPSGAETRAAGATNTSGKLTGGAGSPGVGSGSSGVVSGSSGVGSGSSGVEAGSSVRPGPSTGRRVAELVRGWTEAVEPPRPTEKPAGLSSGRTPTGGTEQPDQKDKVRRRLSSETSAKIPATQSQALGQILTALSRGHSPRAPLRRTVGSEPPQELRSPELRAEVRRLREATAQRLRQARLETSDGEVADSLTSATASEDGGDASLEERLKLIDDGVGGGGGGGGGGGRGGFRYGEGVVLSAGEGLIQRILGGRGGGQRLKPRPAGE